MSNVIMRQLRQSIAAAANAARSAKAKVRERGEDGTLLPSPVLVTLEPPLFGKEPVVGTSEPQPAGKPKPKSRHNSALTWDSRVGKSVTFVTVLSASTALAASINCRARLSAISHRASQYSSKVKL